jgi:surfactin synthase thioesterase subunit
MVSANGGGPARGGRWFQSPDVAPGAATQLFLFHFAGGSAAMYREWAALLPGDVEQQCLQLPGRQDRLGEDTFCEIEPLTDALVEALAAELDDRPYAVFGHCLGAMLAYRLAVAAPAAGVRAPAFIGVSGWAPRGFAELEPAQMDLPDADFAAWVGRLGLLPAQVFQDPQVFRMALPVLRADLGVYSSYRDDGAQVPCAVMAYSGKSDALMGPGAMSSWADRTPRFLGNCAFPGNHFFIQDQAIAVTTDLTRLIRQHESAH